METLAALRKARQLTQVQVAEALGISQGDVSKLEQRTDVLLSTLARFVEATGGRLRVVADCGDDRAEVGLEQLAESSRALPGV